VTGGIPFLDLRPAYEELQSEIEAALLRVGRSGWYLLGDELRSFEEEFARYIGVRHCIGVANGLDALHLSLLAMDVGTGDEVIVPTNTYIATWLAVSMTGARPVPAEPDLGTYNMSAEATEAAVTSRTKAILPVHLYGAPAAMTELCDIGHRLGIPVLEDAAQAHGARLHGRSAGALGTAAAWSFYPGKNLGAFGDGGAVTTDDDGIADRLRVLRNYGSRVKYVNEVRGFNSRLDEIQASVLRVKLSRLDEWNRRRRRVAQRYSEALSGLPLVLPRLMPGAESAWHLYVVRTQERESLRAALGKAGVETLIHYPIPPHRQAAYASAGFGVRDFPVAAAIHEEVLSLPIGPHLSPDQQDRVIEAVQSYFAESGAASG
jgi:dTDP-4-amino-4,6-dideoxygalactose transaminase